LSPFAQSANQPLRQYAKGNVKLGVKPVSRSCKFQPDDEKRARDNLPEQGKMFSASYFKTTLVLPFNILVRSSG
jgi:hypothetical protein